MIFHENCLQADNSNETSFLIYQKLRKMSQNVSSAAVVIGVLRVSRYQVNYTNWCEKTLRLQMKHVLRVSRYQVNYTIWCEKNLTLANETQN